MWVLISIFAGLGIFLLGMQQLERGLQSLGSERVKYWLGRSTKHPIGSVATGTAITAFLQSSSMVSLIVLAFASAGMIQLYSAVGVILGANLGTTFTGWVVATIGFKMDLDLIALPCFGLGALVLVFSQEQSKRHAIAGIVMGFGLLIFGLSLMKEAVVDLPQILSPERLASFSLPMFLLVGILMTAVIQSSSAMTLIALTALNAGIIDLSSAGALVVGADIGTTSTTALGSVKAPPIAKQLALAHLIYNLVVDALAFLVLIPFLPDLLGWLGVSDPLYGLVLFHSSFNLIGLFIFLPILKPFSKWLSGFFQEATPPKTQYLHSTPAVVPEAAFVALKKELEYLIVRVISVNLRNLKIEVSELDTEESSRDRIRSCFPVDSDFDSRYSAVKELEGEMLHYASLARLRLEDKVLLGQFNQAQDSARDAVYAMKTLKDVRTNLVEFRHLLSKKEQNKQYLESLKHFYDVLVDLMFVSHKETYVEQKLNWLVSFNEGLHNGLHESILDICASEESPKHEDIATILNTNREIWHSNNNLLECYRRFKKLKS